MANYRTSQYRHPGQLDFGDPPGSRRLYKPDRMSDMDFAIILRRYKSSVDAFLDTARDRVIAALKADDEALAKSIQDGVRRIANVNAPSKASPNRMYAEIRFDAVGVRNALKPIFQSWKKARAN